MYFLSLFGYVCMFVFVVWQINRPSLWVRSLTSVRCLTMKATIRCLKYVQSPQSENWCLKSTIRSLMYEVWRNLKFDVWRLSENCFNYGQSLKYYVCLFKTWSPKYVQSPKSESETKVWSLSVVWVESLSEVRSKFFAIIITLSYNRAYRYYIYCVFVDQLWQ